MSYLDGPRINFWGGAKTNVDTANNSGQGLFNLTTASVVSQDTDDEIIAKLREPIGGPGPQGNFTRAGWNYYGDHQVAYQDAKVSSAGEPGSVSTDDPLVGQPVYLLGSVTPGNEDGPYGGPVMVDLDPTSSQTTQIYVGGLQIGGTDNPALLVRADVHCHSHFLGLRYSSAATQPPYNTPGSVFANGTFQVGFPMDAVKTSDPNSAIVQALLGAEGAIGIVVRYSFFEFFPGLDSDAIQKGYAANRNPENPSLGRVIGTLGPWLEGEPATCPPGRLLQNQRLGGAQGLAHLDAKNQRLTLDLVSALPGQAIRQDGQNNTAPIGPNVDYGDLVVSTAAGTGPVATKPSLPDTYYLYGGIYDIDLNSAGVEEVKENPILLGGTKNQLNIQESRLRIYSDARNLYLNEVEGEKTFELTVRELGGPVQHDTLLTLSTSKSGSLPDPEFLQFPPMVMVDRGTDQAKITVSDNPTRNPGFLSLNVSSLGMHGSASYFVNFRKYPAENFQHVIAMGKIPWPMVYDECLRFFYLIFPAMSKRIPLNDEATVTATAGEILKRIGDDYRPTTLYMPLTRSLSPGKIALLRAYLEQVSKGDST